MSGLSLILPAGNLAAGRGAAWTAQVVERFGLSLHRLCRALAAPQPSLTVLEEGDAVALVVDGARIALPEGMTAGAIARRLEDLSSVLAWPAILAPALAARGVGATWWLHHAALRGLTLDSLADLAEGGADDETIAWRLADRHPPVLTLRAGAQAMAPLADRELRARAAQDAAYWCGLPVPIPAPPVHDAALGPDEARLALGVLPPPSFAWEADGGWRAPLAKALRHAAPALVDPALALALMTDEARVSRRSAAAALARTGAVVIAQRMAEAVSDPSGMVDLATIVDVAAGIAPP
jgi:hypothetical protein